MTVTSTTLAVEMEDVSKIYGSGRAEVAALEGVSLTLPPGEFVVVLGPSGSGKTTMLNLIGAMEAPTSGRIVVGGNALDGMDDAGRTEFRRHHVGFVFQFFNLVPTLTALENVQLVGELTGATREQCSSALERVGLADRLDHFPGALSGGEQQRVAIARAVVKRPALVLCDEPTGALDLETGRKVLGVLRDLTGREDRTVLVVTHNAAIADMADRVITMHSGEVNRVSENSTPVGPEEVVW